jgi:cytochrome c553
MKVVRLRLGLSVTILAIAFSGVVCADGRSAAALSRGGLQAKIQYCYDCHGSSGRGYRGYFPMPRLAGQTTEYFDNQLRAFVERRRETHIAMPMSRVHGLSPEMRRTLAAHFADLNPKPFGGAQRRLVATGRAIYEEGVPDDNVPACSACHGPEAKGSGPIPRLAGQLYPYTTKELANWSRERGQNLTAPDPSAVMRPIAHSLSRSQIEAVAAYLSYLE